MSGQTASIMSKRKRHLGLIQMPFLYVICDCSD